MHDWEDTIVGPATGAGDGCRAILRITGPSVHEVVASSLVDSAFVDWSRQIHVPVVVRIRAWGRTVEASLLSWPRGRSSTGQASAELHLPAGPPLVQAIQDELIAAGARLAR